jgi:hypothetical protein
VTCRCHGQPFAKSGGCAVRRRARDLARYHADPASANYARVRRALRARIAAKAARITELERQLASQDRG